MSSPLIVQWFFLKRIVRPTPFLHTQLPDFRLKCSWYSPLKLYKSVPAVVTKRHRQYSLLYSKGLFVGGMLGGSEGAADGNADGIELGDGLGI